MSSDGKDLVNGVHPLKQPFDAENLGFMRAGAELEKRAKQRQAEMQAMFKRVEEATSVRDALIKRVGEANSNRNKLFEWAEEANSARDALLKLCEQPDRLTVATLEKRLESMHTLAAREYETQHARNQLEYLNGQREAFSRFQDRQQALQILGMTISFSVNGSFGPEN